MKRSQKTGVQGYHSRWRTWVICSVIVLVLAMVASELYDLPHVLLRGPATPVNYMELILDGMLIGGAGGMVWILMYRFEQRLKASLDQLERLASVDDLTGIPNRRQCMNRLEYEVQRSQRYGRPVSVAIVDLDGFKSINDRHGHLVGDQTLIDFTRLVNGHIRAQDFFGRLGGDEFLVILIETHPSEAAYVLERIREQWYLASVPTAAPGNPAVTLSGGITAPLPGDTSMTDSLRRSDQALYKAKSAGRNRIEIL